MGSCKLGDEGAIEGNDKKGSSRFLGFVARRKQLGLACGARLFSGQAFAKFSH